MNPRIVKLLLLLLISTLLISCALTANALENNAAAEKSQSEIELPFYIDEAITIGALSPAPNTDCNLYFTNQSELIDSLYNYFSNRYEREITVYYSSDDVLTENLMRDIARTALFKLDDYSLLSVSGYKAAVSGYVKRGVYFYSISFRAEYYTTYDEEAELFQRLSQIINDELTYLGNGDFEKALAAYEYVLENVRYNENAEHPFSAYGALIYGDSGSRGYALLLLRLLQGLGINSRIIIGEYQAEPHAWNAAFIDGRYYLLDASLDDADLNEWCYFRFLRGYDAFEGYEPSSAYSAASFSSKDHPKSLSASHSDTPSDNDHICDVCNTPNVTPHSKGDPTCTECATCSDCGMITAEALGHIDENRNNYCDRCNASVIIHEDTNLDHACDYGCSVSIGEHKDSIDDNDHLCDYCKSGDVGEACRDNDNNHACDICGTDVGEHKDANLDHACDYGCSQPIGIHADGDLNHSCDYGCSQPIGVHSDGDLDHSCDYGCSVSIGEHKDSIDDNDHLCDYCRSSEILESCCGGFATCSAGAICLVCGLEYGECNPDAHLFGEGQIIKAPTCIEAGAYSFTCLYDSSHTKEEPIPSVEHSYGSVWKYDGENHWRECICNDKSFLDEHTDENSDSLCDVCGYGLPNHEGLSNGQIIAIISVAVAVTGLGGFSLVWFAIMKRSLGELFLFIKK